MKADQVAEVLRSCKDELRAMGIKDLALFGSAARGEANPDSDLDFLVEFEGPATFEQYMQLKELLEQTFKVRIDLVTRRALKNHLREEILAEAVKVA